MDEIQPDDLGRSFQGLLRQEEWQLDVGDEPPAPAPTPSAAASLHPPPVHRIVEALLFVGATPLTAQRALDVIHGIDAEQFDAAIEQLNRDYRQQNRPYHVEAKEEGYVLAVHRGYRVLVEKLYGTAREARLSAPAVDVLAIVAYRQPVTRQEIDSLRGHESASLLRQLVRRGLVTIVQRAESGGREVQYGTTPRFLELFGLKGLNDLPETEDLQRL